MTWLVIETFVLMAIAVAVGVFLGAVLRQISGIDQPMPAGAGHGRPGAPSPSQVTAQAPSTGTATAEPPKAEPAPAPSASTPEPQPAPEPAETTPETPAPEPTATVAAPEPVAAAPAGEPAKAASDTIIDAAKAGAADQVGVRPSALAGARDGQPDDLKKIKGIGPQNEQRLNALGIYHFAQIAAWTPEEARWVGAYLAFPGRIEREDWVGQAQRHAG